MRKLFILISAFFFLCPLLSAERKLTVGPTSYEPLPYPAPGPTETKDYYAYDNTKVTAEQMEAFKELLAAIKHPFDIEINIKWRNSNSDDWYVKNYFIHTTETYDQNIIQIKRFGCFDIQLNKPTYNMAEIDHMWFCTEVNYKDEFIRPIGKETFWQQVVGKKMR